MTYSLDNRLKEIWPFLIKHYEISDLKTLVSQIEDACSNLAHTDMSIKAEVNIDVTMQAFDMESGKWKRLTFKIDKEGRLQSYELRTEESI
jgi:hypothetical protein